MASTPPNSQFAPFSKIFERGKEKAIIGGNKISMDYCGFGTMSAMMTAFWSCPLLRAMRLAAMYPELQQAGMDRCRDAYLERDPICPDCKGPIWHFSRTGLCDKCRIAKNMRNFKARHPHYHRDYIRRNGNCRKTPDSRRDFKTFADHNMEKPGYVWRPGGAL